jgi:hypothetical protein
MTITVNGKKITTGETWECAYGQTVEITEFDVRQDKVNDMILESNGVTDKQRQAIEDQYLIACGTVTDTQHGKTFSYDGAVYVDELTRRRRP